MYYRDKLGTFKDLFGTEAVTLENDVLVVAGRRYPVIDDVIVLTEPGQYTPYVKERLSSGKVPANTPATAAFAPDIQFTFGEEWKSYGEILPEHREEFDRYFDIVDLGSLGETRACDLGCGMGRWSFFLADRCREIVLVDFSDAIFVARKNLGAKENCLFFMADLKRLPFRDDFAGFLFSLGVLHHLPTPCLDEVRALKKYAPLLLVFLYYALDNRPAHYRALLSLVTFARRVLCRVRSPLARTVISKAGAWGLYLPLVLVGRLLKPLGLGSAVPLYDFYHDKSMKRIEQDVYDRFFTRIEQRVSRQEILSLKNTFREVAVSPNLPYWHFLCRR